MMSASVETQCASASESNTCSTVNQGYVLPEGKIMPNTVFVGGIDLRMNEAEIRTVFERYGTVKEVKVITDRTGVSKGYGFVSFLENVDVQKIVESVCYTDALAKKVVKHCDVGCSEGMHVKTSIKRIQKYAASYVHPRPLVVGPPPPQFHSVWGSPNTETYVPPPPVMSPVPPYVQPYPYSSSPTPAVLLKQQVPIGYQPAYNYQGQPQWLAGEQRNYVIPPAPVYPPVNYHSEDPGYVQMECAATEPTQLPANSPQKKSVDRAMQTVVSCLSNPENQPRNDSLSQDDNVKESKVYHFRKGRAALKSV